MSDRQVPPTQQVNNQNIRLVPVPVQGAYYPHPIVLQPGVPYYPGQIVQPPYQFVQSGQPLNPQAFVQPIIPANMQPRVVQVVPGQILPRSSSPQSFNETQAHNNVQATQQKSADDKFFFYLNEKKIQLDSVDPTMTLNDYIRGQPGLKGTKKSCGEGGCGACTVGLQYFDMTKKKDVTVSVNSCLKPLASVNGQHVITIEGIGSKRNGYHPIQERLAECDGTQCGFCSPGFVMNMYSFLDGHASPSKKEIEHLFDGNICRCTGYRPIFDAMKSFAKDGANEKCSTSICDWKKDLDDIEDLTNKKFEPYQHKTKRVGSRPNCAVAPRALQYNGSTWYSPQSLSDAFGIIGKNDWSQTRLLVGNTSLGIYKSDEDKTKVFVDLQYVPELKTASIAGDAGLIIGAAVTISDLIDILTTTINNPSIPKYKTATFPVLIKHLYRIAGTMVRNAGSIMGNLMLVHRHNFLSDLFTIMMGAGASITIASSADAQSTVDMATFLNTSMQQNIAVSLNIPFAAQNQAFKTYKVAVRHVNSHALVNAAINVTLNGTTVATATIVYGGVAAHAVRMAATETFLIGKDITSATVFQSALKVLQGEVQAKIVGDDRKAYRVSVALAFFYKFFLTQQPNLAPYLKSAAQDYDRPVSGGARSFQTSPGEYPVSLPMTKLQAKEQTAGEVQYTDDIPPMQGTLYGAYVLAEQANADIVSIDASAAMALSGVVGLVDASDITGVNSALQAPVFADGTTLYHGQPVALIVANDERTAYKAAKLVKVKYANQGPLVLTLEDAIKQKSFFNNPPESYGSPITTGDVDSGFKQSDIIIEGTVKCGSQYHFHMENQTAYAVPLDDSKIKIYAANQMPANLQSQIASVLDVSSHCIDVEVKRCGGGYGGKLENSIVVAAATALACRKFNAPVRVVLTLNDNMKALGKRHPALANYKIGLKSNGKMVALKADVFVDGGATSYATDGEAGTLLQTFDNAYYCPNYLVGATLCKTNTPSNTWTRGPGWIPAVYLMEHIMEHAAGKIGMAAEDLKRMNFYVKNQKTPPGQKLAYWNLDTIWDQLVQTADLTALKKHVGDYNKNNYWTKKGISVVPVKFGVGWGGPQHGAKIDIYSDGSISVSHTGVEIGQGLNTKVAQVVAFQLGVPMELIKIEPTTTLAIPNGSATGGSVTSAMVSRAAIKACDMLNSRLNPIRAAMDHPSWKELINQAFNSGANLSAQSLADAPAPTLGPNNYNSYSAAICLVHVDILTGEIQIERSDILFDCGVSMNPAVDIGQVEGAFMMGLSYYLSEEITYRPDGSLINDGTWEYKPFSALDIPIDLNVCLLKNSPNPVGVLSSKAVGEPPLALGCAGLFAAEQAINAAKKQLGTNTDYQLLAAPATVDVIQQSVGLSPSMFILQ